MGIIDSRRKLSVGYRWGTYGVPLNVFKSIWLRSQKALSQIV